MRRRLLPSILLIVGYLAILLATIMPLFEWQITQLNTDFPSAYEVSAQPSPWTAKLGDALGHGKNASFGNVYVSRGALDCRYQDVNFNIKRSRIDETLELISTNIKVYVFWLFEWQWVAIGLSIIYIWWFTIWHQYPINEAIILTVIVAVCEHGLTQLTRNLLPRIMHLGTLDCYHGTITFNAVISKVHHETLIVLFVGILLGLVAFGMMPRQIIKSFSERKKASNR